MTLKEEIKDILKESGRNLFDYDYGIHDYVINNNEMNKVVESIMGVIKK